MYQSELTGKVRAVHVMPSVDDAAEVEPLVETAAKTPVVGLHVTAIQYGLEGKLRPVHVIPLVDEAAAVVLLAMATKTPVVGLQATPPQFTL